MCIEIAPSRGTVRGIRDYFTRVDQFRVRRLVISFLDFSHMQSRRYYASRTNMNFIELNSLKYRISWSDITISRI